MSKAEKIGRGMLNKAKSFVSMETSLCPICGKESETGAILLDQRLRDRFEMKTPTAWKLCQEHQDMFDDGYLALVECDPTKSVMLPNGNVDLNSVYRTGRLCFIKRHVARAIFDIEIGDEQPMFCVEPGVIDQLNLRINEQVSKH